MSNYRVIKILEAAQRAAIEDGETYAKSELEGGPEPKQLTNPTDLERLVRWMQAIFDAQGWVEVHFTNSTLTWGTLVIALSYGSQSEHTDFSSIQGAIQIIKNSLPRQYWPEEN